MARRAVRPTWSMYDVCLTRIGEPWLVREGGAVARLTSPDVVGLALRQLPIPVDGKERFGVIGLSIRHEVLGVHVVSVGCMTSSLVHPREVFLPAILMKAAAVILWHTHPSGCVEPSAEDLSLTRRLVAVGATLGIEVLDHLIVPENHASIEWSWCSLKTRGAV